jgi:hypothetical protein
MLPDMVDCPIRAPAPEKVGVEILALENRVEQNGNVRIQFVEHLCATQSGSIRPFLHDRLGDLVHVQFARRGVGPSDHHVHNNKLRWRL